MDRVYSGTNTAPDRELANRSGGCVVRPILLAMRGRTESAERRSLGSLWHGQETGHSRGVPELKI